MHAPALHLPHRPHLPEHAVHRALRRPARAAFRALETVIWLTRDLGCSSSGHDPVASADGRIACRRCTKRHHPAADGGRGRWAA